MTPEQRSAALNLAGRWNDKEIPPSKRKNIRDHYLKLLEEVVAEYMEDLQCLNALREVLSGQLPRYPPGQNYLLGRRIVLGLICQKLGLVPMMMAEEDFGGGQDHDEARA